MFCFVWEMVLDRVSLCIPGSPGTHAGIEEMHYHALPFLLSLPPSLLSLFLVSFTCLYRNLTKWFSHIVFYLMCYLCV